MRIAVCCKGVPVDPLIDSVSITNGDIQFKSVDFYINEIDAYALEAALSLKSSHKAETVALCLGPLRTQEVLYYALAKGIDQAIRIDGDVCRPELVTGALKPVLKELNPQLILVGAQSEDWMGGEVGIFLAQSLNMAHAYAVIEICDLKDSHVRIKKEVGGGKKAEAVLKLPAVLCVQSGIQPLRYLSSTKRQKARNLPVKVAGKCNLEDAKKQASAMAAYEVQGVVPPVKDRHAVMIEGDRLEKSAKVLEIITKTS
jgi:electron transfer flavoprotein beta subunit